MSFFEKIKISIEQKIIAGFIINIIILLATGLVFYKINSNLTEQKYLNLNREKFFNTSNNILNISKEVEDRAKDFILTGDENALGEDFPRIHSLNLHLLIKDIYKLTEYNKPDNEQEKTLDTLEDVVDKYIYAISEYVRIQEEGLVKALENPLIEGNSSQLQLKNKTKELVVKAQKNEDIIFQQNLTKNMKQTSALNITLAGLLALMFLLIIIVYFIISYNLEKRKESERKTSENESLLQSVIDNTTNRISIKNITGDYILVNKQFEKLFHLDKEQIKGKTDYDLFSKEIADILRSTDLEVIKAGKSIEKEEDIPLDDDLHTFITIKFPLFDFKGKIYAIGGIATDITERKKLDAFIKDSEQQLKLILSSMGEGVIVINTNTEVILSNKNANDMLEMNLMEMKIKIPEVLEKIELLYPNESASFPYEEMPLIKALRGESSDDVQVIIRNKNNPKSEKRLLSITGRPVKDEKNEIIAGVVVIRDISKYKKVEEELEESQQKYRRLIGYKSEISDEQPVKSSN